MREFRSSPSILAPFHVRPAYVGRALMKNCSPRIETTVRPGGALARIGPTSAILRGTATAIDRFDILQPLSSSSGGRWRPVPSLALAADRSGRPFEELVPFSI